MSVLVIATAAAVLLWAVIWFNRLVRLRSFCGNAWSLIEVLLQRRHELVPVLADTVRAYAVHERDLLDGVAEARAKAIAASSLDEASELEPRLEERLGGLLAVAERYPGLEADAVFLDLQERLVAIEDELRFARQFYNDTAMKYNTALSVFPGAILAGIAGFPPAPYFMMRS